VILDFVKKHGDVKRISIFPGINYGHLEFENVESSIKVMKAMDEPNVKTLNFYGKDRYVTFFYTQFE
jgi:hypothetical protein